MHTVEIYTLRTHSARFTILVGDEGGEFSLEVIKYQVLLDHHGTDLVGGGAPSAILDLTKIDEHRTEVEECGTEIDGILGCVSW